MQYLRQNTATTLIVGPFKDKVDGVTTLTAMEVSSLTIIDFYKGATKSDVTTTSAATHAMAHVANGYYSLTVTTGDVDTGGIFKITADAVSALAVWHDFMILPTQQYDTMFGGGGMAAASTITGVAQASAIAVFTASVFANLSYASQVAGVAQASSVAAFSASVFATLASHTVALASTLVWVNGVAQASSLSVFNASVFATLASHTVSLASTLAWVQTETATTIWAYTVGSAPYSYAYASQVAGVAQASSISILSASVFATLASHTIAIASTLAYVQNTTATTIWAYTVGSAPYSYAYASQVAGVAQASSLAVFSASAMLNLAYGSTVSAGTDASVVWAYGTRTLTAGGGGDTATTIWAYPQGSTVGYAYGSTVAGVAQASLLAAVGTTVWEAVRADHDTVGTFGEVASTTDMATAVWAYAARTLTAGGGGDTATTIWAYPQGSAVGYAYGSTVTGVAQASSLAIFNASVFATLASHTVALASTLAWVQTETATTIWAYTVGSAQYSYAYASTVNGVAQASSLAVFGASVFSTLASHTVTLASTLAYVQNTTATTIWAYTVGSAPYSYAYASTVAGVAQASTLAVFSASAMLNLAYGSSVVAVKVETASTLVWVQNAAMASTVNGVAQASSLAAFGASAMLNLAYGSATTAIKTETASVLVWVQNAAMASTVDGVAQASALAAFGVSAMLNLAYGSAVTGVASSMLATLYEGTHTFSDYLRVTGAVMAGKTSGGGTASVMFFSIDGATARIAATVDANNNRTSVVTVTA